MTLKFTMLYSSEILFLLFLTGLISNPGLTLAQNKMPDPFIGYKHLFTQPKQYVAKLTPVKPNIDGNLEEKAWENVTWTTLFLDIEGDKKPMPFLNTRCKMIWDKEYLYIAADLTEPHVWANVKEHDEIVFFDNDFEVFIDPDNDSQNYFEIEMNALNTIWDLYLPRPYRNQGAALFNWEARGMKTAVKIKGTINDPSAQDEGWTLEMAIPYRALQVGNDVETPKAGDFWRINFSRVEWDTDVIGGKYIKKKDASGKNLPERNWVWSPQGVVNMHLPERWGYLHFAEGTYSMEMPLPIEEKLKRHLWLGYYKQVDYFKKNKRYANTLQTLGLETTYDVEGTTISLELDGTKTQYVLVLKYAQKHLGINQDGLLNNL